MNYFIYPLKNMRITQNYNSEYSHKKDWYNSKDYKDYPIDDGGENTTREGIYCPCDEMIVTEIKGVGNNKITNTIWLKSTTKVTTPTFTDIAFMTLTHSNDKDFKNIKVGTKFKRGDLIVYEGENVNVATHIHMVFGRGTSNNWINNSNKALVIKGDCKKPEEVCFIDKSFTKIINDGEIKWVEIPKRLGTSIKKDETKDQIEILVDNLRARKDVNGTILGYINKGIYNILDVKKDDNYTWYKIENFWIAYSDEWAKLYNKKQEQKEETTNKNEKISILKQIIELIEKMININ